MKNLVSIFVLIVIFSVINANDNPPPKNSNKDESASKHNETNDKGLTPEQADPVVIVESDENKEEIHTIPESVEEKIHVTPESVEDTLPEIEPIPAFGTGFSG
ncbi:uncharacterized protein LOC111640243 [Centruroides sculpturatus]|uniref:uncharacterized protein LOC111615664 n=1 Tax=Centruroides sculpturatus TaxID=218467 RepID=UPI000C6EB22F